MNSTSAHAFARSQLVYRRRNNSIRNFNSTRHQQQEQRKRSSSFRSRLRIALKNTKVEWYQIPVGLGIGFLGLAQLYKIQQRDKSNEDDEDRRSISSGGSDDQGEGRPKKRERIRPSGPWQVQIMSTLPLKALSRLWGRFNELEIPYYLRVPGFRLYSWVFGVNLSEVAEPDLHSYPNLASFFYRTLKPGSRPLDPNPNAILSPADGRILQYGIIEKGEVEQVKGMTYSLDALLGAQPPSPAPAPPGSNFWAPNDAPPPGTAPHHRSRVGDEEIIHSDEEFARVNGISYTLPSLLSGGPASSSSPSTSSQNTSATDTKATDASTTPSSTSETAVRRDLSLGEYSAPWYTPSATASRPSSLHYAVIYLAPGDYHRFHSPCAWVVSSRRHFAGELYSVSPYLQRTLPGLFTLNERVVLLGRWRWGFFSLTPVGATNVGSIKINFDRELRTNSLTTDTEADRAAEAAANRGDSWAGYVEATYAGASRVLGGFALRRGEEMGGFQLGSTVVLVFEAPVGAASPDAGSVGDGAKESKPAAAAGWKWVVERGQRVKVGEALGVVVDE
ncbi:MAG: hypothetical protein M1819_001095 [Sarea resinae]|nr:MAG: hypothetical protein M1819_001095 [Sarea resinae]